MQTDTRNHLLSTMHLLRVVAGLVLLAAFSWELFHGYERHFTQGYLVIQLVVCCLFLIDFAVSCCLAERRGRYLLHNLVVLLLSIPWLNIVVWSHLSLSHGWAIVVGLLPILRVVLATWFLVEWIDGGRIHRIFYTYLCGVLLFTYLSALVFYDYEALANPQLHGFGNALWWAGLNLSTAGAPIVPVTAVGKLLSVLLPVAGMLFLPIFTTYILQSYDRRHAKKHDSKQV